MVALFCVADAGGGASVFGEVRVFDVFVEVKWFISGVISFFNCVDLVFEVKADVIASSKVNVGEEGLGVIEKSERGSGAGEGAAGFPFEEDVSDGVDQFMRGLIQSAEVLELQENVEVYDLGDGKMWGRHVGGRGEA